MEATSPSILPTSYVSYNGQVENNDQPRTEESRP